MATTKRMFSNDIVGSDAFIEMPQTSQNLYFHLGMRCDDDGFVNPNVTMRMIGANKNDMDVLISKRFLLAFQNGVVVIKHHRINNKWDSRDCRRTLYTEELKKLFIKENNSYTFDTEQGIALEDKYQVNTGLSLPDGNPTGVRRQNRIEENRIEKKSNKITKKEKLNSSYEEKFESWWKLYPRKVGKGDAYDTWELLEESVKDTAITAIENQVANNHFYYDWVNNGKGGHNPPHPVTWLNQKRWDDAVTKKLITGDSKNVQIDGHSQKLIDNMKNKTINLS